jgi:hypothetical protein
MGHVEANKKGFFRLFSMEANWRILHAKRLKTDRNMYSFLSECFQKNRILLMAKDLWKAFLNNLKQNMANIR